MLAAARGSTIWGSKNIAGALICSSRLGNYEFKYMVRTTDGRRRVSIQEMKLWIVFSSGSLGECEYKYVVRNTDGSVVTWTPGSNFALQLPPGETPGVGMPERVEVNDAWDSSWRQVQVHPLTPESCSAAALRCSCTRGRPRGWASPRA